MATLVNRMRELKEWMKANGRASGMLMARRSVSGDSTIGHGSGAHCGAFITSHGAKQKDLNDNYNIRYYERTVFDDGQGGD